MLKRFAFLFTTLFLLGCNNNVATTNADGSVNPSPKTMLPVDAGLAVIYQRSCKACHSRGLSGAPVTGNKDQWQPRINKGMKTLLQHTLDGFRGMPPRGSCMDCSAAQYEQIIRFMAQWPAANASADAAPL